ncbi:MAG: nitroreductase [Enterobacterales bacterium]|jgi:nitroreductase
MNVAKLLETRNSCRGFKSEPVDQDLLTQIFQSAQQSPSNCNVQPWKILVVSGDKKEQLKKELVQTVIKQQKPNPDFKWDVAYQGVHRERQFGSANALYTAMDIPREDKMKRQVAMLRNWEFFDAPHVVIFTLDKYLGIMGAVDVGIYAQTLSLLLHEHGISSCMQGALGQFPDPIHRMFDLSEDRGVLFGMSFGYANEEVDANKARTSREDLAESVQFIGS